MPTSSRDERGSSTSTVSEVKSDELAKMLEGVSLEGTPQRKIDPKISRNLKSSLKSSPPNSSQRKVQFTNRRKTEDLEINLDDPLADLDLSDFDNTTNDKKKLEAKTNQYDTKSNKDISSATQTLKVKSTISKPLSPLKVNDSSSNNLGNPIIHEETNNFKMSHQGSPLLSGIIPRRTSLQPTPKRHNDDDLFSLDGKSSPKREFSPARQGTRRNSSFMSELFGHKKPDLKAELKSDFVIDEKYKHTVASSVISENGSDSTDQGTPLKNGGRRAEISEVGLKASPPRRGRRGTAPTLNIQHDTSDRLTNNSSISGGTFRQTEVSNNTMNTGNMNFFGAVDTNGQFSRSNNSDGTLFDSIYKTPSGATTIMNQKTTVDDTIRTKIMAENNNLIQQQVKRMEGFEIQQQDQFRKDLEEQKRIMQMKQKEYKDAMEQQRNMTQEQILGMQERQSAILKQQQLQAETMLKQIQSQMESEMRMKSEMLRNQLNVFSDIQSQNPLQPMDISTLIQELHIKKDPNDKAASSLVSTEKNDEIRSFYEKKCGRLKDIHAEELKELNERNSSLLQRCKEDKEEHQKNIQIEKDRRLADLSRLRDEQNQTLEEVRTGYVNAMEKVKELKLFEYENAKEAGASVKAAEALLGQISKNTSNLSELQEKVEIKVSKHVDVREALLKKKDEELHNIQMKMNQRMDSESREQEKLRGLIESLEKQMRERETEMKKRENQFSFEKEKLQSEIRKFQTEKEITISHLKEEQDGIEMKEKDLEKEKSKFRAAMELEHRNIISRRMKLTVSKKINGPSLAEHEDAGYGQENNENPYFNSNELIKIEMEALSEAFKDEESKLARKKDALQRKEEKIGMKKEKLKEKEKLINGIAKGFIKLEKKIDYHIKTIENVFDTTSKLNKDSKMHLEECFNVESSNDDIILEAEQKLHSIQEEAKKLAAKRDEVVKERKRLLNTRNSLLCNKCQDPLANPNDMKKYGLTNLGLRTAGDGEMNGTKSNRMLNIPPSEISVNMTSLKEQAYLDHKLLDDESQYFQSLAN